MAYEDRSYSGNAVPSTLAANISNTDRTIFIGATAGWPDGTSGPFHIRIDSEVIRVSGRDATTLTVQSVPVDGRGWDGTTAAAHITGAVVEHVFTATDADEANQHIVNAGLDHHTQYLTVGRHDIAGRHGFAVLPTTGTPSASAVGDTATAGSSNNVARVDHRHAREGFGPATTSGPVNVDGVLTTTSRSDHKHAGGIPIIANPAARPGSPTTTETVIETSTKRMVQWTGSRWQRGPTFSATGRTGVSVGRAAAYSVPDAGPSSYVLPWDTEISDSDGFIGAPDGTTTHTITVPASDETGGFYIVTAYFQWASVFTQRSYIEIVHGAGGSFYQHRVSTTGEDRATVTTGLDLLPGNTVQFGLWQNSGGAVNATFAYMYMFRLFA